MQTGDWHPDLIPQIFRMPTPRKYRHMVEVADPPKVHVREVREHPDRWPDVQVIPISRAWGRSMYLLVCPGCSRRCRILYDGGGGWRCLRCAGLTYRSQWSTYRAARGLSGSTAAWIKRLETYERELARRTFRVPSGKSVADLTRKELSRLKFRPGPVSRREKWLEGWLKRYGPFVDKSLAAFLRWRPGR